MLVDCPCHLHQAMHGRDQHMLIQAPPFEEFYGKMCESPVVQTPDHTPTQGGKRASPPPIRNIFGHKKAAIQPPATPPTVASKVSALSVVRASCLIVYVAPKPVIRIMLACASLSTCCIEHYICRFLISLFHAGS